MRNEAETSSSESAQGGLCQDLNVDELSKQRFPTRRRLVVVTPTEEIEQGKHFVTVAITSTLPVPLTSDYVLLPSTREDIRARALPNVPQPSVIGFVPFSTKMS